MPRPTPAAARELVHNGHRVLVETMAGHAIGLDDEQYRAAGATIAAGAAEVFAAADMVVKVKEPQPVEVSMLRPGQVLFTYLHLAAAPGLAHALIDSGCVAIAYETVSDRRGALPLLSPMSEVAGRMAIQAGAHCLEMPQGGRGQLLDGVPAVPAARVVILGVVVVGTNAAQLPVSAASRSKVRLTASASAPGLRGVRAQGRYDVRAIRCGNRNSGGPSLRCRPPCWRARRSPFCCWPPRLRPPLRSAATSTTAEPSMLPTRFPC